MYKTQKLIGTSAFLFLSLFPVKRETELTKYVLGNQFANNRYLIERTITGMPMDYIHLNDDIFPEMRSAQPGDIVIIEESTPKSMVGIRYPKRLSMRLQKDFRKTV